jgi:hypothetical protein
MKNEQIMGFFFYKREMKMLEGGNEGMSTIPGFNQIQFEGFCRFIDQGLIEELYKFPKIEDTNQEIEFQFTTKNKLFTNVSDMLKR